jgi:hypothetical protein
MSACSDTGRRLHFDFLRSPVEFVGQCGALEAVRLEKTELSGGADGSGQAASGTGAFETLPAQLALKSIGYKSVPVDGVAFDERHGVVCNT